jgi:Tol biopolymer transport system component
MTRRVRAVSLFLVVTMILTVALTMFTPAMAVKGSYPGSNGKVAFDSIGLEQGQTHRDIFVMNNDGTNVQQLTHNDVDDTDPCWSPDGTEIAFSSGDQIWVMDSDGSNLQGPLTTPNKADGWYDDQPAWSPDGSKIAFIRNYLDFHYHYLYVIGADGSDLAGPLTDEDDVYSPHWSLDGGVIAVGIGRNLALVNPTPPGSVIAQTNWDHEMTVETLSWSPDNSRIAFSLSAWSDGHSEIYWMKGDLTGTPTPLTDNPNVDSLDPDWSPDGTKIIFTREETSVWIMNVDGSGARDLTPSMPESQEPDYQRLPGAAVGGIVVPVDVFAVLVRWLAVVGLVGCISAVVVVFRKYQS